MDPSRKPRVQWDGGKILGRGQYGTITLGFMDDESSRTPVAVKSAKLGTKGEVQLRREKEFLDQLRWCPQVIRCYGASVRTTTNDGEAAVAAEGPTYNLFLEYAPDGSLRDYLWRQPMNEGLARRLTRSMLQGLAHIHRHGVTHCDIKPDNIMLWGAEEVKIIDFGLAFRSGEWDFEGTLFRGTPHYLAPECVSRSEYKAPADVWALGCTVAEMLTGEPATAYLDHLPDAEFFRRIASGGAPPKIPERMSEFGRRFLSRCFEVDTAKRWTAEMLLRHPYVAQEDNNVVSSSSSSSSRTSKLRTHTRRC